jgi:N-alpha-acetyltransferase 40
LFTQEAPTEGVVYVYEIQIDKKYQRLGLGKKIMDIIETITSLAGLGRIMLTVFKANECAVEFYRRIDYSVDETSPSLHNEPADYEILSKKLVVKQ